MPLSDFARVVAVQYGVALSWSETLDKRVVSIEADRLSVDELLRNVARRLNVSVEKVGKSYFLGESRHEDKGYFVRSSARLKAADIKLALQSVLGPDSHCEVFADGLCVVVDRAPNLRRASAILEEIEAARADTWVVQLYLFSCSKTASREIGIDTTALVDLSYTFAKTSLIATPDDSLKLAGAFSAVMKATATREDVDLVGKPLFVLADGEKSNFNSGLTVPVPKRSVSDQGTVTTQGFDYIQSGFTAECSVRDWGAGTARLEVKVSIGQITGFVESAPIQSKEDFQTVAVVASSGVYLLGALDRDETRSGAAGLVEPVLLKRSKNARSSQLQLWARLYKIGGPVQ